MLKAPFTPYSEKLRQSVQRRTANNQSSSSNISAELQVGDRAPDFTLYNTSNEEVSLNNLIQKSNVILLFFPLAFSDVCTNELCSIRDNMNKFTQLNATIVGISIDSMFALKKFQEDKHYSFDLLSDFNKETARKYHVLYEEFPIFNMKGVTKRATFLIDQNGLIQYIEILDNPSNLPDLNKLEDALDKCSQK